MMTEYDQSINQHYGQTDLSGKILEALQNAGKDIHALTRRDISSFDEFHIGGIAETRNLAQLAGLRAGMRVLDVGSGLGGPARTLADEFGCYVTGIDLTAQYCRAAEMLTARVGLADRVKFECGNATKLPFANDSFDVVWTQFAGMNIEDKAGLYDEFRRVLKNGGRLALHEIMSGEVDGLHYPVLWADQASIDFRRHPDQIRQLLRMRGFEEAAWKNLNPSSIAFFQAMLARIKKQGSQQLGFNVFIVDNFPQKVTNVLRNMEEERVVVIQAVFQLAK